MFYTAIDKIGNYLRAKLPRDSSVRNLLITIIQLFFYCYYRNPINRHKWTSNHKVFEKTIEQYCQSRKDFFVIQVGACDGLMDDPICNYIKKYRWRGILIEPQRQEFERLRLNYDGIDNLIFENVAIADVDGVRPLYKVDSIEAECEWQRGIATFYPTPNLEELGMAVEMVQCITFDTLINRHQVKRIDLLQIDVEGYDYEILKLLDLTKIKPRLIRYEHRHLSLSDMASCRNYLVQNGYKVLQMQFDTGAVLGHD